MEGIIYKALSGFYYIKGIDGQIYQTRARGRFRQKKNAPLVGDTVEFNSSTLTEGVLTEIKTRKNQLYRPTVANVDQAIVVVSLVEPDFSHNLLDRFLVVNEFLNINSIIYLSKADLIDDTNLVKKIKHKYTDIGYPVIDNLECDAKLISYLSNKITVVMGQSGVGKSTLLNKLLDEDKFEVGQISKALGRGRHTTRHVELVEISDGLIIDTPGFSSLDFKDIDTQELKDYFVEFRKYQKDCKFRECQHLSEPKCSLKEALVEGYIDQRRYKNYCEFHKELEQQKRY